MACCLGTTAEPVLRPDFDYERPLVRMCAPGNQAGFPNFVDIGDTVVLFVDFGDNFQPMEKTADHPMGGATAGNAWPEQRHQAGTELYEVRSMIKSGWPPALIFVSSIGQEHFKSAVTIVSLYKTVTQCQLVRLKSITL